MFIPDETAKSRSKLINYNNLPAEMLHLLNRKKINDLTLHDLKKRDFQSSLVASFSKLWYKLACIILQTVAHKKSVFVNRNS